MINIGIYNNASNSDTFLECKDYVKFLGVLIDKKLNLNYHMDYIASKFSFNPSIQFSDFPIYVLRNCCMGPRSRTIRAKKFATLQG